MARGQRVNLAELHAVVGEKSPVEKDQPKREDATARTVPLTELTANPRNLREELGDLADLQSIADIQLQPATVVTKEAYLELYPDDPITTRYVVINGCRRLAAAHKYGRSDLAIAVNNTIARDRVTLISASIAENVDRQDFDVIEEARAVEALIQECGYADVAAEKLRKSAGWVSQRRSLLQLAPELQTALRRGELAIREARQLARVPLEEQVTRWQAALDRNKAGEGNGFHKRPPSRSRVISGAIADFSAKPELLANALRTYLGPDGVQRLRDLLADPGR
jgi:ParB family transcriptional regulator, chromosome partitioning protein